MAEQYGMCQPAAYDDDTEESYSHSEVIIFLAVSLKVPDEQRNHSTLALIYLLYYLLGWVSLGEG